MPGQIPPALLQMMQGAGKPGAPGPGAPPSTPIGPAASPMSNPQQNSGEKMAATVKVQQAMDLLEMTLLDFGSESEEGAIVLQCLSQLGKKFGGAERARSKELMPAEIMNLVSSLPRGPGGVQGIPGAGGPPGAGAQPPPMQPTM